MKWNKKRPRAGGFYWAINMVYDGIRKHQAKKTGKKPEPLHLYAEQVLVHQGKTYSVMFTLKSPITNKFKSTPALHESKHWTWIYGDKIELPEQPQ